MVNYDYEDIETQPNIATYGYNELGELILISGIQFDVANSDMDNKDIVCGTWWAETELLSLTFTGTLSTSDKSILDSIVENNS
jgi:hypothetical protein